MGSPYYNPAPARASARATGAPNGVSSVSGPSSTGASSLAEQSRTNSTSVSTVPASSTLPASSTVPASSQVSSQAGSNVTSTIRTHSTVVSDSAASRSLSERSRSHSRSDRAASSLASAPAPPAPPPRATYIIKPTIVGLPTGTLVQTIPTHTFLSTSISLLLYLAVMVIIFSVECPFDREVGQFFAFVLLAFASSLFTMIVNLTAVRHHRYNCVNTSLSLFYSGSASLVVFGLVDTSINGLCKPNKLASASIFESGVTSNYFIWVMSALSVLWQLVAHYYYG